MKKKRHEMILKLIKDNVVSTQEDLLFMLCSHGFDVTQATVSRDIKELGLIKKQKNGVSRYSIGSESENSSKSKMYSIFSQSVISVDYAINTSVIKCYSGTANAAAAALDSMNLSQVVGSLAGDDTLFVLCRTENDAKLFKEQVEKMLNGE